MLPNFLVVGTMKSGTSTLVSYLGQHPNIYLYPEEINLFGNDAWNAKDITWYSKLFTPSESQFLVGEKSNVYSYVPTAAGQIHQCLPHAKLIWIFRNPIERAYSNYWFNVSRGYEPLAFEEALAREAERTRRDIFKGYIKRSEYAEQVARFMKFFPRTQLHFLLFEEMTRCPKLIMESLCAFLEVDANLAMWLPVHSKVTWSPRWLWFQYTARCLGIRQSSRLWRAVNKLNGLHPGYEPMKPQTWERLAEHFQKPNMELARLTGLDLTDWESVSTPQ